MRNLPAMLAAALLLFAAVPSVAPSDPSPGTGGQATLTQAVTFRVVNPVEPLMTYDVRGTLFTPAKSPRCDSSVLLLLHGASYASWAWDFPVEPTTYSTARALAERGYASVAIDFLGFGASDHPNGYTLTIESYASMTSQVVDQLSEGSYVAKRPVAFGKVAIMGHSLGTEIGYDTAAINDKVTALVAAAYSHEPSLEAFVDLVQFDAPQMAQHDYFYLFQTPEKRAAFFYNLSFADPAVVAKDNELAQLSPSGAFVTLLAGLLPSRWVMPTLRIPVFVVLAEKDVIHPPDRAPLELAMLVLSPDKSSHIVPQAGHTFNLHPNAPESNAVIADWLDARQGAVPRCNLPPHAHGLAPAGAADRVGPVTFTDASTDEDGSVVAWAWDFGDGTGSRERHPQHRYARLGAFPVTLTVTDDGGETAMAEVGVVEVRNLPPTAAFSGPLEANRVDPAAFTDLSRDPDGSVVAWRWDFGDGAGSEEQHPSHQYTQLGTYTATLTVTDNDGAEATASGEVRVVNLLPQPAFTLDPEHPMIVAPQDFEDATTDRDGSVVAWHWDLGDGATSGEQHPTHIYLQGGWLDVALRATDNDGGEATVQRRVYVCQPGGDLQSLVEPGHVQLELEACVHVGGGAPAPLAAPPDPGAALPFLGLGLVARRRRVP